MTYGVKQDQDWNALSDADFRAVVRADFEANYPAHLRFAPRRLRWSEIGNWYLRMAEKGWIAPNWPAEYGGMGLSPAKLLIFIEEQERWGIARFQDHGVLMVGPVLQRFGTEEQRRRFLPKILTCENIWSQGYSEPGAGSDLAGLSTRARRDGDHYVIDGHKIWTTLAQDATHMFVLVRTNTEAKKQEGISFLLVDITSPGITVRPIRDMAGHEEFCEVFFDGVCTPVANLVGEENGGWTIAKSLLGFERIFIGSPKLPEYGLAMLKSLAQARGVADDPLFVDKFTALQLDVAHLGDLYERFAATLVRGEPLGPDVSILKIWATETFQRIADLGIETAGDCGGLTGAVPMGTAAIDALSLFYKARVPTIYGGSNEIQRNILARQVLDLPS
ncbi:MAG: acyl-CoA dehydrogenase family protein [Burkholderiales bacterium]|nr:acyl-CoA dehydrogenase family protein [Burkholderiales bacterium]